MPDEIDLRLQKYIDAIRYRTFQEPHRSIFPRIAKLGRRIFALQRYLAALNDPHRGPTWIENRTAMTEGEFREWRASSEFTVQSRELGTIIARFAAANPDHRLVPGSRFRSLDEQIDNWESSGSVGAQAPKVLARTRREISDATIYPDLGPYLHEPSGLLSHTAAPVGIPGMVGLGPTALASLGVSAAFSAQIEEVSRRNAAIKRLTEWLAAQRTGAPSVTVATPGLSNHGVGQAIDFQIRDRDGDRVLGASNPRKWHLTGWSERLADAVRPSPHFTGPLRVPDEPWHWTFDPSP